MTIFKSRKVTGKGGFVELVDLETSRAVGFEASRAWVIRHLADLPSLSQPKEQSRLQIQRLMISTHGVQSVKMSPLLPCLYRSSYFHHAPSFG